MILTDEEISHIAMVNPPMVHEFARAIESAVLRKLRERPADAWLVRRLDAPFCPVVFMHKPVDALADPERSVQQLHIIPAVNE